MNLEIRHEQQAGASADAQSPLRRPRGARAFTMIELMVVMSVIVVLVSLVVPEGVARHHSPGTSSAGADAQIYRTCLCTLILEVYYRYLKVG